MIKLYSLTLTTMNFLNSIFDEQYLSTIVEDFCNETLTQKHEKLIDEFKNIAYINEEDNDKIHLLYKENAPFLCDENNKYVSLLDSVVNYNFYNNF